MVRKYYKLRGLSAVNLNSVPFYVVIRAIGEKHGASGKQSYAKGIAVLHKELKSRRVSKSELHYLIQARSFRWYSLRDVEEDIPNSIACYKMSKNAFYIIKCILREMESLYESTSKADIRYRYLNKIKVGGEKTYWREQIISNLEERVEDAINKYSVDRGDTLYRIEELTQRC